MSQLAFKWFFHLQTEGNQSELYKHAVTLAASPLSIPPPFLITFCHQTICTRVRATDVINLSTAQRAVSIYLSLLCSSLTQSKIERLEPPSAFSRSARYRDAVRIPHALTVTLFDCFGVHPLEPSSITADVVSDIVFIALFEQLLCVLFSFQSIALISFDAIPAR
jgi:hypothetical protein